MSADAAAHGMLALRRLVDEERAQLDELESLLAAEHAILGAQSSVETLESACASRQECMGRLLRIQDERRTLLAAAGHAADAASIAAFLDAHDPAGVVRAAWGECAELAQRCRDLNDRNGALGPLGGTSAVTGNLCAVVAAPRRRWLRCSSPKELRLFRLRCALPAPPVLAPPTQSLPVTALVASTRVLRLL